MTKTPDPNDAIQVLRIDNPRSSELERAGWSRIAESWGARLRIERDTDLNLARSAVAAAPADIRFEELSADAAERVQQLDQATIADYPVTPQNAPEHRTLADVEALWSRGARVFGAMRGTELLGVTVVDRDGDGAETDFTAVERAARGQGIASALKAYSVLTLAGEGVTVFGTGGADVNGASIAMNERVGYVIEERWVSLTPPRRLPAWKLLLGAATGAILMTLLIALGLTLSTAGNSYGIWAPSMMVSTWKTSLFSFSGLMLIGLLGIAWPILWRAERRQWSHAKTVQTAFAWTAASVLGISFLFTVFPGITVGQFEPWYFGLALVFGGIPAVAMWGMGSALALPVGRRPRIGMAAVSIWLVILVATALMPVPVVEENHEPGVGIEWEE